MRIRKAFVMTVKEGREEEYQTRHTPIWSELESALKAHGVSNYSIFLLPATRQLFAYAEIESEAQWEAIAETQICKEWWESMTELMPTSPDSSPVSEPLREVFHLD